MRLNYLLMIAFAVVLISCGGKKEPGNDDNMPALDPKSEQELFDKAKGVFGVMPTKMPGSENDTPEMVELGKKLYFDTRLSVNGEQSCNTCHDVEAKAGVDNLPVSPGAIEGKEGVRNSPTVLNAGFHFVQFWDGRSPDLVDQAKGPILNPDEMAFETEAQVEETLGAVPEYQEMFAKAFPDDEKPLSFHNTAVAIAAFERTLISRSRYDDYIAGINNAMNNTEKRGMKLFIETGCITCHTGHQFGANIYQKMGLVNAYENKEDKGRFDVTGNEADKYMFKVASLRNVALTQPYFHDGAVNDLSEAVKKMAWMSLGKELKDQEVEQIVAFLKALTDKKLEQQMNQTASN
jgi:cytochrome c peroxidase